MEHTIVPLLVISFTTLVVSLSLLMNFIIVARESLSLLVISWLPLLMNVIAVARGHNLSSGYFA